MSTQRAHKSPATNQAVNHRDTWRFTCPEGHAAIEWQRVIKRPLKVYCFTCETAYTEFEVEDGVTGGSLHDHKPGDWP